MIHVDVRKKLMTAEGPLDLEVNFHVNENEFATLYGPSGSGKTTILKMIAGLVKPDGGRICVNGETWFDEEKKIDVPARKRNTGFVFQDYSLFPNMTVRKNLEFALDDKNHTSRVDQFLDIVGMTLLQHQKPAQLSGGQKQRVALIRALLRQSPIYLLDEPLAALDGEMRLRLQDEIIKLYRQGNITTLFVSHDLSEVFKLSQKVFLLDKGKIIKSGPISEVFTTPHISGKFKLVGDIVQIIQDQGIYIVTVLAGNILVKVVASPTEAQGLKLGSKVIVASKAFNPIILPL